MVIAKLRSFFDGSHKREAQELYIALVEQSRKPFFYTECGVPDTIDGRFDIILLHIFLGLRLQIENKEFSRLVLESFFADMDRNLREMGVGDMGVAKRIQKMSKAVFGRIKAYTDAYDSDEALTEALTRNVYRGENVGADKLALLLKYVRTYKPITET